ncbi:DUF3182 family protein [Scytonema hofmannii FACHB-248]|uniref:DUF3182 family protein n=1 Tax=Scytonema hofmannii FACHB-248 TaxID=1842502 RepID=A0ABR8GST5_9CYAN|nr:MULTISPECIES: DUF3182 family protein [Nostocales]MBD2606110.1 DUF3182 family protein [Scytonema hofmannii FACHB-248]
MGYYNEYITQTLAMHYQDLEVSSSSLGDGQSNSVPFKNLVIPEFKVETLVINSNKPPVKFAYYRNLRIAAKIAEIFQRFGGIEQGKTYYVADKTIVLELKENQKLIEDALIESEKDFFGGIVARPHQSTKAIMHPLVSREAVCPLGWSHEFSEELAQRNLVLPGFTVFSTDDLRIAFKELYNKGVYQIRLKDPLAFLGMSQFVISSFQELEQFISDKIADQGKLQQYGLVVEENLHPEDLKTYSASFITVGSHQVQCLGVQRFSQGLYTGTDLVIMRTGKCIFPKLLAQVGIFNNEDAQAIIDKALLFRALLNKHIPEIKTARFNLDIVSGIASIYSNGTCELVKRFALLEQSFRVGGASPGEIWGLESLLSDPDVDAVCASTYYRYGDEAYQTVSEEEILYCGVDNRFGPISISVKVHGS